MSSDGDDRREQDRLLEVAAALADGSPVDWAATESVDPQTTGTLKRLRSIERLSDAFREAVAIGPDAFHPKSENVPSLFTWGHLQVRERVAAGGFGEVYRAWDPGLDREVALKLLRKESAGSGNEVRIEEAHRLARVRHPNMLTVHGAAVHDGIPGLWSDLIEGETLEQILHDRGAFGASEVVAIGIDVCRALAALHSAGIVHGDVKAANVMREDGGRIVLMDLSAGREVSTVGGPVYGTTLSAAPEVLAGGSPTSSSDVYSVGALLFRMLTGRHVEDRDAFGSLRDLRPDVPVSLAAVVERALAAEPAVRFVSAGTMSRALQAAVSDNAGPIDGVRRMWPWRPVLIAFALITAVAAAFASVAFFGRPKSDGPALRISALRQFGALDGSISQGAFSPDSSRIAFISDASGSPQIWVSDLAGAVPRRLTDTNIYVNQPTWTPDGSRVVFTVWGAIQSVAVEGGTPTTLLENAWNANAGRRTGALVFERSEEIWIADANGANARKVMGVPERDTRISERLPAFSPDESLIAFVHGTDRPWGEVWIVPAKDGAARQVTTGGKAVGRPTWSADGRRIIFASRGAGSVTLWQADVGRAVAEGPQAPARLTDSEGDETAPAVAPDGRTLLFTVGRSDYSISVFDIRRGIERPLRASRLQLLAPTVSKDGRVAFFGWGRDGGMHVYTMDANGGSTTQVTSGDDDDSTFPVWSANGRELFFYRERVAPSWRRVDAEGGRSTEVKAGWTATNRSFTRLDPTGRYAVYTWQERDVPRVTRLLDLVSGTEREFHRLLRYPSFTADGQALIGVDLIQRPSLRAGPLVLCPITQGACRPLAPLATHSRTSADGAIVYFQRPIQAQAMCELWSVRIDGSDLKKLHSFTTETAFLPAFDVAPSGDLILSRLHKGRHELWLADLTK